MRKKIFSAIVYFGILLLKNWLRLWWQFKLNIKSCEPADEEELPTFSLGIEFLTPQKEQKEKENKEHSLRYEALDKFGEHSRSFRALQTSRVLHILMNAR